MSVTIQTMLKEELPKYDIEFNGYFSNHLAHGLVALDILGAEKSKLDKFVASDVRKLNPSSISRQGVKTGAELFGKTGTYADTYSHYRSLYAKYDSLEGFVNGEFPKFIPGMVSALLHCIIHLGYGVAAKSEEVVTQGLAYFHHSYVPLNVSDDIWTEPWGVGGSSILEVLDLVRNDGTLLKYMMENHGKCDRSNGSNQAVFILLFTEKGNDIARYSNMIRFPDFYDPSVTTREQDVRLGRWLVNNAILLYACSDTKNNFVLVHGVTAAWALLQVLQILDDHAARKSAQQVMTCILLAAYVTQSTPAISLPANLEYDVSDAAWQKLVSDVIKNDREPDVHVYKLVQVCYNMRGSAEAVGLPLEQLYMLAARVAVENDEFSLVTPS